MALKYKALACLLACILLTPAQGLQFNHLADSEIENHVLTTVGATTTAGTSVDVKTPIKPTDAKLDDEKAKKELNKLVDPAKKAEIEKETRIGENKAGEIKAAVHPGTKP